MHHIFISKIHARRIFYVKTHVVPLLRIPSGLPVSFSAPHHQGPGSLAVGLTLDMISLRSAPFKGLFHVLKKQ